MAKVLWKAGTVLAPLPAVMVSCGDMKEHNIVTVAWCGIVASEPPMTYISLRPDRFSHGIISKNKEFVINLVNLDLAYAADWCGVKSGKNVNKFKELKLTPLPCSRVKAPQIAESPVSLECRVTDIQTHGSHDMFLAEIIAVNVDDQYLEPNGKFALEKAKLVAYAHGFYQLLGDKIGKFGFSVEKKPNQLTKRKAFTVAKPQHSNMPAKARSSKPLAKIYHIDIKSAKPKTAQKPKRTFRKKMK